MFLKRKRTEEEDLSPDERTVKLKKSSRENKKQIVKKKPWGKKERYFILFFVASTAIIAIGLAFVARRGKLPGIPRIDAPSLGLQETVVFTKSKVPEDRKNRAKDVISQFTEETSHLSGVYALAVVDLTSGDFYGTNQFDQMQAASLMKLPVMSLLLKEAEAGRINLDAPYTLKNSDKVGGSGSIISKPEGTVLTYRELLEYMGKQSDNTAFNVVRTKLGDTKIEAFMDDIGMTHSDIKTNMTTPEDIALVLRKLYEGRIVPIAYRDLLFDDITDTIYEQHLRRGVPEEVQVAHKYGREVHVVNDAGVVFTEKPYVVVIMTDGVVEKEADTIFPRLSEIVYNGQL